MAFIYHILCRDKPLSQNHVRHKDGEDEVKRTRHNERKESGDLNIGNLFCRSMPRPTSFFKWRFILGQTTGEQRFKDN